MVSWRNSFRKFDLLATFRWLVIATLLAAILPTTPAFAAQITSRKLTLGTSAPSGIGSYTFNFTVPTTGTTLRGIKFLVCTNAAGTCTTPTGWSSTAGGGATLASQPTNAGSGWVIDNNTAYVGITNTTGQTVSGGGVLTVQFNNVTNPSTTGSFYVRISTFNGGSYATQVDTGTVAASTATQIQLTGIMPESLIFCTGLTITSNDCSTATGSTANFGYFGPTFTAATSSVMAASTNAASGYVITVNGATLTSGSNTIAAFTSPTAPTHGVAGFGLNVVANSGIASFYNGTDMVPQTGFGSAVTGPGVNGAAATGYNTADQFKFVTGNTVASSGGALSDTNTFTVSYVADVPGNQPAGTYTATMTYICTATY